MVDCFRRAFAALLGTSSRSVLCWCVVSTDSAGRIALRELSGMLGSSEVDSAVYCGGGMSLEAATARAVLLFEGECAPVQF